MTLLPKRFASLKANNLIKRSEIQVFSTDKVTFSWRQDKRIAASKYTEKNSPPHQMKHLTICVIAVLFTMLTSCDDNGHGGIMSRYDGPFPKRNIDLTDDFGTELLLKNGNDTVALSLSGGEGFNLITEKKTGDTLFYGIVSKFRGLYYFSQRINDSSWWINAVRKEDNLVWGLGGGYEQMWAMDSLAIGGGLKNLITDMDTFRKYIRLHTEKKIMKRLYRELLANTKADTILSSDVSMYTNESVAKTADDSDDYEIAKNVYPNPTTGMVNVELEDTEGLQYQVTGVNGKVVSQGEIRQLSAKIDLSNQQDGVYLLLLINGKEQQKETIKILKKGG
jgi:hypothetical protein